MSINNNEVGKGEMDAKQVAKYLEEILSHVHLISQEQTGIKKTLEFLTRDIGTVGTQLKDIETRLRNNELEVTSLTGKLAALTARVDEISKTEKENESKNIKTTFTVEVLTKYGWILAIAITGSSIGFVFKAVLDALRG